jgi:hypothetical protein
MKPWRLLAALSLLPALLLPAVKAPVDGATGLRRGNSLNIPAKSAGGMAYRLEYRIRGGAMSRVLLFFPLRVFYEAYAAVDLTVNRQPEGSLCFTYAGVSRPAYVLRTLGFSGRSLALLSVGGDEDDIGPFADSLLARWQEQEAVFAGKVKTVKIFPHRLQTTAPLPFAFRRDVSGFYRDISVGIEPLYRYAPANTGIYFNVFPMLAELLTLLNHPFLPAETPAAGRPLPPLPPEWDGDELDFSADLNRLAGLLEKAVKSMVTVKQKFPFRLRYRLESCSAEEMEICGEAYPDVPVWKGVMIREVLRRVRLRPADGALLADEIWMGLRNGKGQGGYGWLQLRRMDITEDIQ